MKTKNILTISGFVILLIILFPLIMSNNYNNYNYNNNFNNFNDNLREKYINKYNCEKYNNFNKFGPPLGPSLPPYPWPPSL